MTIRRARHILTGTWLIGLVPLIFIITFQTYRDIFGFGASSDKGVLWFSSLMAPFVGIISSGTWSLGHNENERRHIQSTATFYITLALSCTYLGLIMVAIGYGVRVAGSEQWDRIFHDTALMLSLFQGFLSLLLTRFFIEIVAVEAPE